MSDVNSEIKPASRSAFGSSTPLDATFILLASLFLFCVFLWLAQIQAFTSVPPFFTNIVTGFWSKVVVGSGAAGAIALRKWLYQTPAPNYLLWIPGCTVLWIALLYLTITIIPPPAAPSGMIQAHALLTLESLASSDPKTSANRVILFKKVAPGYFENTPQPYLPRDGDGSYAVDLQIPNLPGISLEAGINHQTAESYLATKRLDPFEYTMCLQTNPSKASGRPNQQAQAHITCARDGQCTLAGSDLSGVSNCDKSIGQRTLSATVNAAVYKHEMREAGWIIPSLDTLLKTSGRQRVGYTRFDIAFPAGPKNQKADRYFYSVRVNGTPVYIDGFLPDATTYPLQHERQNTLSFALENLAFRGEHDGYEQLEVAITFLEKETPLAERLTLTRSYPALRDAPTVTIENSFGTSTWSANYAAPLNENRYNIILESSPDLSRLNGERNRLDTAFANNSYQFAGETVPLKGPVVTIVRPPRYTSSYGLGLGIILPTRQVQFTFNLDEAKEFCHWVATNVGHGKLVNATPMRYDSATRNGPLCE